MTTFPSNLPVRQQKSRQDETHTHGDRQKTRITTRSIHSFTFIVGARPVCICNTILIPSMKCRSSSSRLLPSWMLCLVAALLLQLSNADFFSASAVYEEDHCKRCDTAARQALRQCRVSTQMKVEKPTQQPCKQRTWFEYVSNTVEVLVRGFMLGFGLRLSVFLVIRKEDSAAQQLQDMRDQILIATITGISFACIFVGMSLLAPTWLRTSWFQE